MTPVAAAFPTANRNERASLAPLVKIRLKATGETFCFPLYKSETVLSAAQEQTEMVELQENDYEVLGDADVTRQEWEQHLRDELRNDKATRLADTLAEALRFMSDEGAVAFVKYTLATYR